MWPDISLSYFCTKNETMAVELKEIMTILAQPLYQE